MDGRQQQAGIPVRTAVLALYGGRCHYCGGMADTLDHIVPRCVGGVTRLWNLTPACGRCNGLKGARRRVCCCYRCEAAERTFAGISHPTLPRRSRKVPQRPRDMPMPRYDWSRCPGCSRWRAGERGTCSC